MEMEKIEHLKKRCTDVEALIKALPASKLREWCRNRLLKTVQGELKFLSSVSSSIINPICSNICYIEAVVHVLQQKNVNGVTCINKMLPAPVSQHAPTDDPKSHVDIIGMLDQRPVWFVVSSRNPKNVFWLDQGNKKGLKTHLQSLNEAAVTSDILQPSSILLCFAKGIELSLVEKLKEEFQVLEKVDFPINNESSVEKQNTDSDMVDFQEIENGDWINVICKGDGNCNECSCSQEHSSSYFHEGWMTFEMIIKKESGNWDIQDCVDANIQSVDKIYYGSTDDQENQASHYSLNVMSPVLKEQDFLENSKFFSLISCLEVPSKISANEISGNNVNKNNLVNLDTTALVALVSGLSNGSARHITELSDDQLLKRFKTTSHFMLSQAKSELQLPLLDEALSLLSGKRLVICDFVHREFEELIALCSGPNENYRATCLQKYIMAIPNHPSARVMSLPETGKIKLKHKIIFGTGDYLYIPTLTANMSFVRAVMHTGMALSVLEHRPRALSGD